MTSTEEEPKTKKQRTSTEASTHVTSISTTATTTTTKLDSLPNEILLCIAEFTGAHTCYLGYGVVNKRINQIFNTYSNKLSKTTSYGGYAPFQEVVQKCEIEVEKELEKGYGYYSYEIWEELPMVYHQLASGVVTFNRSDLLDWALEKQSKFIFQAIFERAWPDGKLSFLLTLTSSAAEIDCLRYLYENGCKCDEEACREAARNGHVDFLKYLHEHGPWDDEDACLEAARGGHLDCLIYLYENGCDWNEDACYWAAYEGQLECLKYIQDNGLEWYGDDGIDKYDEYLLHEQGFDWNEDACHEAAYEDQLECLKYMG